MSDPVVTDSARKRGFKDDDILHAFRNAFSVTDLDDGFVMVGGADRAGRLLEVGFVMGETGPVIVHCMECRTQFLR